MTTKMKGLLKGLRYISQIFDEDKEPDMQIGFPTDVKHVAHIGWDGPSVDSPSWMKEFKSPTGFQSAPLAIPGDPKENPEIKWVSEDGKNARGKSSSAKDQSEAPRSSSRRQSSTENSSDSPKKEKSRHSRKHHSKDSSDSVKNRQTQDSGLGSESPSNLPDIPKKSRRKKSKESISGGSSGSVRSRNRGNTSGTCTSPVSDAGNNSEAMNSRKDELSQTSNLKPRIEEGEKESSGIF
ncbi:CRIB domain-containing protein RIC6-like [Coffea eugenioides]|uniref:CRIB domain-containing protein n=1 Tax=Coffea arabica TaxID=13443 RepID=A0A6P6UVB3_COFAR|nr:CRIB domain-containing protein RIC6-like [Coffea arabica]XP_027151013.1 CRIB domain-containing protein RIC6-like [Coffea eugenioides]